MKKRNFILLIVFLVILALLVLGFFYLKNSPPKNNETGGGAFDFLSDLIPFGKKNNAGNPDQPVDVSDYRDDSIPEVEKMVLTKVSSMPVAGYKSFLKERFIELPAVIPGSPESVAQENPTAPPTEFALSARYVSKIDGNIFQTWADRISERRFTDTMIPRVHEAFFTEGALSVVLRYLRPDEKTVASFLGRLPQDLLGADASTSKLIGEFLPDNITDLTVSGDGKNIFYTYNLGDNAIGMTANSYGENKTQVLDSAFTEWLAGWPTSSFVNLTTRPSGKVVGQMYEIDPVSRNLDKVFGGVFGLTTLASPNGNLILYSNNNLDLSIYDRQAGERNNLKIHSLPEKCTWTKDSLAIYCAVPKYLGPALYPDSWYQGEVGFEDQLWRVDVSSFKEDLLIDFKSNNEKGELDAVKLELSPNGDYLFFINKKDSYLWELRLR